MTDARGVQGPVHSPRFHLDHRFTRRRLSAYHDGELGPVERRRVEHHIADCPDCGRAARSLHRVIGGLSLLRRRSRSGIAAGVIERLRTQTRRSGDP